MFEYFSILTGQVKKVLHIIMFVIDSSIILYTKLCKGILYFGLIDVAINCVGIEEQPFGSLGSDTKSSRMAWLIIQDSLGILTLSIHNHSKSYWYPI